MKRRVLHVLSSKEYSGAENVAINIIKSLEQDYEFAYTSPKGSIMSVLEKKDIKYLPLESNSISCLNLVLKEWEPNIIHAHDFKASIKVSLSPYRCAKISHLHQNPSWIKRVNLKSILYSISCLKLDKVVTVSSQILEEAIFSQVIKNKSSVLENNVDIETILNSVKETDCNSKYDLIFVGRLAEVKDPLKFIRIVKELTKEKKEIKAVIVGDGELRAECERLIKNLKLSENIEMKGFISNPFAIVNNSKILVMTSAWEGFGLVAVEAMILGKPVFATSVGGLKNIVNSYCGKLCNSEEEFSEAIINTLSNSNHYKELSDGAKKNILRFVDKKSWINNIRSMYDNF